MTPRELPESLLTGAHPRAALARAGVGGSELRGPLWQQAHHGLWSWAAADAASALERIRRAAPLVRGGGAIGGWGAARLLGATGFDGEDAAGEALPVLVCLPRTARCRRSAGVRVLRSDLGPGEVHVVDGVPVTSVVRTCVDLARLASSWREGVVDVDCLRAACRLDVEHAAQWIVEHRRWRGVPQARRALAASRDGVASPQETRLRLLWTQDAGLAEPLVNARVLHGDGLLLCEADLLDPATGLVAEFDGAHHAPAVQRAIDHQRREQMRRAGLTVVVVTTPGLSTDRQRTLHELQSAQTVAQGRDRSRDAWYLAPL